MKILNTTFFATILFCSLPAMAEAREHQCERVNTGGYYFSIICDGATVEKGLDEKEARAALDEWPDKLARQEQEYEETHNPKIRNEIIAREREAEEYHERYLDEIERGKAERAQKELDDAKALVHPPISY
jgi:hypothetical protein